MRTALDFSHALSPFNDLHVVKDLIEPLARAGFHPACDIEETQNEFFVSFDLPGVAKEDVKIELEENELSVSGERREERPAEPKRQYHFAERTLGKFHRVFTLSTAVDPEGVEARFNNGVLQITLPKAAAAKPRQIQIT